VGEERKRAPSFFPFQKKLLSFSPQKLAQVWNGAFKSLFKGFKGLRLGSQTFPPLNLYLLFREFFKTPPKIGVPEVPLFFSLKFWDYPSFWAPLKNIWGPIFNLSSN